MAEAISKADRRSVPLNSICSMKWAAPLLRLFSCREPPSTQAPMETDRTWSISSVTTRMPFSRRVLLTIGGSGKSPYAALRFLPRHCGVQRVRLIPQESRALPLGLLAEPPQIESFLGYPKDCHSLPALLSGSGGSFPACPSPAP